MSDSPETSRFSSLLSDGDFAILESLRTGFCGSGIGIYGITGTSGTTGSSGIYFNMGSST